ncbi:MAG: hypothetical protein AAB804_01490 [Patescibacteria group bacterium]|mgnify:CR=1 FL=1
MYKNWKAICAVRNPHLKRLIITANEKELGRLAQGFPELFLEKEQEHSGPFPLSLLRKVADDLKAKCFRPDRHPNDVWGDIIPGLPLALGEIGLDSEWCVHPEGNESGVFGENPHMMSDELIRNYRKLYKGYRRDMVFPWGLRIVHWEEVPYFLGDFDHLKCFLVYPAAMVDLNS